MMAAVLTASAEETRALGEQLGRSLANGDILLLHGGLGAGKTTLTQGILNGLNATAPAQSPTFMLVSEHLGETAGGQAVTIRHVDLYRLTSLEEVDSCGYAELLDDPDGIVIVEWPERAMEHLPSRFLLVSIDFAAGNHRTITMTAFPGDDRPSETLQKVQTLDAP